MKSMIKKQWTQITAVIAAAACAVTATVAGVSGSFSAPINAYALEEETSGVYTLKLNQEVVYANLPEDDKMIGWEWADFNIGADEKIQKVDINISTTEDEIGKWLGAFGSSTTVAKDQYWTQTDEMEMAFESNSATITWDIDSATSAIIQTEYNGVLKWGIWWVDCGTITIDSVVVYTDKSSQITTTTTEETTTTTEVTITTEETPDTTTTTTELVDGTTTTEETTTTETTTTTTVTTTTVTTTTAALDFKNITIGAQNKTPVTNKCCLFVTMKAAPGTRLKGYVYYGNTDGSLVPQPFDNTTDADGYLRVAFRIRKGLEECDFQIQEGSGSVMANFTSYYWGDASLNGKVNGSDVRAIINYIKSQTKSDRMEIVCDYNNDNSVGAADAVALTKALLSLAPPSGTAY